MAHTISGMKSSKKRIDKSHVRDTTERITQPGMIAIIYAHEKDAVEYLKYLEYLKGKKLLTGEIERLELEELQGVSGLKALRMAVMSNRLLSLPRQKYIIIDLAVGTTHSW